MTNEELIQQAKDQVAQRTRMFPDIGTYQNFDQMKEIAPDWQKLDVMQEAAFLAIQRAREEGIEIIEEALACAQQDVDSVLKNGLKKLTAPGR